MAELADATDLGSVARNGVLVRFESGPLKEKFGAGENCYCILEFTLGSADFSGALSPVLVELVCYPIVGLSRGRDRLGDRGFFMETSGMKLHACLALLIVTFFCSSCFRSSKPTAAETARREARVKERQLLSMFRAVCRSGDVTLVATSSVDVAGSRRVLTVCMHENFSRMSNQSQSIIADNILSHWRKIATHADERCEVRVCDSVGSTLFTLDE